ncbi:MAG: hypothetical protein AAF517_21780, partial [Planctomycetota bacterium]
IANVSPGQLVDALFQLASSKPPPPEVLKAERDSLLRIDLSSTRVARVVVEVYRAWELSFTSQEIEHFLTKTYGDARLSSLERIGFSNRPDSSKIGRIVEILRRLLSSEVVDEVELSVRILRRWKIDLTTDDLVTLMSSSSAGISARGSQLIAAQHRESVSRLVAALRKPSVLAGREWIKALWKAHPSETIDALIEELTRVESRNRELAAWFLLDRYDTPAVSEFHEKIYKELAGGKHREGSIVSELSWRAQLSSSGPDALPPLADRIGSSTEPEKKDLDRFAALLKKHVGANLQPMLDRLAQIWENDEEFKSHGLHVILRSLAERAAPIRSRLLADFRKLDLDADPEEAAEILWTLALIGKESDAVLVLAELVAAEDTDTYRDRAAAWIRRIVKKQPELSLKPASEVLAKSPGGLAVYRVFSAMGSRAESALPTLWSMYEEYESPTQLMSIAAVSRANDERVSAALGEALKEGDVLYGNAAVIGMLQSGRWGRNGLREALRHAGSRELFVGEESPDEGPSRPASQLDNVRYFETFETTTERFDIAGYRKKCREYSFPDLTDPELLFHAARRDVVSGVLGVLDGFPEHHDLVQSWISTGALANQRNALLEVLQKRVEDAGAGAGLAVDAIGWFEASAASALPVLQSALLSDSLAPRALVALARVAPTDERIRKAIEARLGSTSMAVRLAAIHAVGEILERQYDAGLDGRVVELLAASSERVRTEAVLTMLSYAPRASVKSEVVLRLLDGPRDRAAAAAVLLQLRYEHVEESLLPVLDSEVEERAMDQTVPSAIAAGSDSSDPRVVALSASTLHPERLGVNDVEKTLKRARNALEALKKRGTAETATPDFTVARARAQRTLSELIVSLEDE